MTTDIQMNYHQRQTEMIDWYRLLPQYWVQSDPTCKLWDAKLNKLLDEHELLIDGCRGKLGNMEVWLENYPYGYGSFHPPSGTNLPTVKTRLRLRKIHMETLR